MSSVSTHHASQIYAISFEFTYNSKIKSKRNIIRSIYYGSLGTRCVLDWNENIIASVHAGFHTDMKLHSTLAKYSYAR